MKIWVIGRGYPTTANGMWGSFELEQAKLLARNGYEVSYIALTLSFLKRKDPRGFRKFEENGVSIFLYSHLYFPGKLGIYIKSFEDKWWKYLMDKAKCDSGTPNLIHVHYPSMLSSIDEIEKYRKKGVKIFVTEHWSRVLINNLKNHEIVRLRYYGKNANCFASVSIPLLEAVRKLVEIRDSTEIIPNIVSPVFFETVRTKNDGGFTFISVGRLVPLKQFDIVITQFLQNFSENDNVRLKIIGAGTEKKKLMSLAGNSKQIFFEGELTLQGVANEIANANALVSYSRYETFAAPVAEAWACGLPIIVSNNSGIAAFVNKENGVVVDKDSSENLGKAMRQLYERHVQFKNDYISLYAKENFSDGAIMRKLSNMYSNN